ncbi:MAG: hypothetical protein WDN28_15340 [Chthoniobacter sp.]
MGIFGLVFLFVALVLIGIGIAIGTIACLAAAVLVGLGVVSSSFVVALRAGRPSAGIRMFLLQCGVLAGIPAGAVCAWLGHNFYLAAGSEWPIVAFGALGGALAGGDCRVDARFHLGPAHAWAGARVQSLAPAPAPRHRQKRLRARSAPGQAAMLCAVLTNSATMPMLPSMR